jgi:hypothetical protein
MLSAESMERVGMWYGHILRGDMERIMMAPWAEVQPLLPYLVLASVRIPSLYAHLLPHLSRLSHFAHGTALFSRLLSYCTQVPYDLLALSVARSEQLEDTALHSLTLSSEPYIAVRQILQRMNALVEWVREHPRDATPPSGLTELLDNALYLPDLSFLLPVILTFLPQLWSLADFVKALLQLQASPSLLVSVVLNIPSLYVGGTIHEVLLDALRGIDISFQAPATIYQRVKHVLMMLSHLERGVWRSEQGDDTVAVHSRILHSVVLQTARRRLSGAVSRRALGDLLTTWFLTFAVDTAVTARELSLALTPFLNMLRRHLFTTVPQRLALSQLLAHLLTHTGAHDMAAVAALAQLYALALGLWDLRLAAAENRHRLVELFVQTLEHNPDPHLAHSVLCFTLLLGQEAGSDIDTFIERLLTALLTSHGESSCRELLVFTALHAHLTAAGYRPETSGTASDPARLLDAFLTRTLNVPVVLSAHAFTRLQHILMSSVLPTHRLLHQVASLPITSCLSATSESLALHCVLTLLTTVHLPLAKGRTAKDDRSNAAAAYVDFNIDLSPWLFAQLQHAVRPLHPLLLPLLDIFVQSVVAPRSALRPFPPPALKELLSREPSPEPLHSAAKLTVTVSSSETSVVPVTRTAQLLFVYYILTFNAQLRTSAHYGQSDDNVATRGPYDVSDLFEYAELWALLRDAEVHYPALYPPLLALVLAHAPQLTNARLLLAAECAQSLRMRSSFSELSVPLSLSSPLVAKMLERLQNAPVFSVVELSALLPPLLSAALRERTGSALVSRLAEVWCHSLYPQAPEALCLLSARALLAESTLTHQQLLTNPLHLFAFHSSLLEHPPLFSVFLHILHFYLTAARQHILEQSANINKSDEGQLLIGVQQSAVVQLLGELCLCPSLCTLDEGIVSEVHGQICRFLHNMFIDDPDLVKVVHFQGYSSALIPLFVRGIPSLHIAFGFLPELLQHPQRTKQLFAIQLTAQLCTKYPIPRGLDVARQAVNVLRVCCAEEPSVLVAMSSSLTLLGRAFPLLLEELTELLLPSAPSVSLPAVQTFHSLLQQHILP